MPLQTSQTIENYRMMVRRLLKEHPRDVAMSIAVGGNYKALGQIERDLLLHLGLQPHHRLVDVGCGSGRLAQALAPYCENYLGFDIVAELLDYAREQSPATYRFDTVDGFELPLPDASVDLVTFFSVFTHLQHEESYSYLQDAKRVLTPNGRIVFSYLDFNVPGHWSIFGGDIARIGTASHFNNYMDKGAIIAWAHHLGLAVERLQDGGHHFIPLTEPVAFDDGRILNETSALGPIGQSVAVLRKIPAW